MQNLMVQTIAATTGSLAFGIVYKVKAKRLPVVAIGGGIGWFLYSLFFEASGNVFLSNAAASVFATGYSEVMARKLKAPVVVFLLPCLIPLVPGGGLYYTMSLTVLRNMDRARSYLVSTVEAAFGIAVGVIVVSVLVSRSMLGQRRASRTGKKL